MKIVFLDLLPCLTPTTACFRHYYDVYAEPTIT